MGKLVALAAMSAAVPSLITEHGLGGYAKPGATVKRLGGAGGDAGLGLAVSSAVVRLAGCGTAQQPGCRVLADCHQV